MAWVRCGTVAIPNTVSTTVAVTGLPGTPNAVILFWGGRSVNDSEFSGSNKFGIGFFTGTTSRRVYTIFDADGVANAQNDRYWRSDACFAILQDLATNSEQGLGDVSSMDANGFTLITDDSTGGAHPILYMAIGGITSAEIIDFSEPGGTGNVDYATTASLATGLDDKAVIIIGGASGVSDTNTQGAAIQVGICAGSTPVNAIMAGGSEDASANSNTNHYTRAGECMALVYADTLYNRGAITAWDPGGANGFRINWTALGGFPSGAKYSALVLKGGGFEVGDITTSTGTTNQAEGTTYQPHGMLFISSGRAANASGTIGDDMSFSLGAAQSATARVCAQSYAPTASATMKSIGVNYTDRFYGRYSTTPATDGAADLVTLDATPGFTWKMDDADASGNFVAYLSVAEAPVGGASVLPVVMAQYRMRK